MDNRYGRYEEQTTRLHAKATPPNLHGADIFEYCFKITAHDRMPAPFGMYYGNAGPEPVSSENIIAFNK